MESLNLKKTLGVDNYEPSNSDFEFTQYKSLKGVALWLIENTAISFKQIADFCKMHILEIEAIANDETGERITPHNPIFMQLLNEDIIETCSKDHSKPLAIPEHNAITMRLASKRGRAKYTTITKKKDKPDAIFWIIKNHPYISDNQIIKLIGTTKNTIQSIKDKTYKGMKNLKPRSPVALGFCSNDKLENAIIHSKVFHERLSIENSEEFNFIQEKKEAF
jgi:hypothetical protein